MMRRSNWVTVSLWTISPFVYGPNGDLFELLIKLTPYRILRIEMKRATPIMEIAQFICLLKNPIRSTSHFFCISIPTIMGTTSTAIDILYRPLRSAMRTAILGSG
jgi:hypothetical protein